MYEAAHRAGEAWGQPGQENNFLGNAGLSALSALGYSASPMAAVSSLLPNVPKSVQNGTQLNVLVAPHRAPNATPYKHLDGFERAEVPATVVPPKVGETAAAFQQSGNQVPLGRLVDAPVHASMYRDFYKLPVTPPFQKGPNGTQVVGEFKDTPFAAHFRMEQGRPSLQIDPKKFDALSEPEKKFQLLRALQNYASGKDGFPAGLNSASGRPSPESMAATAREYRSIADQMERGVPIQDIRAGAMNATPEHRALVSGIEATGKTPAQMRAAADAIDKSAMPVTPAEFAYWQRNHGTGNVPSYAIPIPSPDGGAQMRYMGQPKYVTQAEIGDAVFGARRDIQKRLYTELLADTSAQRDMFRQMPFLPGAERAVLPFDEALPISTADVIMRLKR